MNTTIIFATIIAVLASWIVSKSIIFAICTGLIFFSLTYLCDILAGGLLSGQSVALLLVPLIIILIMYPFLDLQGDQLSIIWLSTLVASILTTTLILTIISKNLTNIGEMLINQFSRSS